MFLFTPPFRVLTPVVCPDLVDDFSGLLENWGTYLATQWTEPSACLTVPAGSFGGTNGATDRLALGGPPTIIHGAGMGVSFLTLWGTGSTGELFVHNDTPPDKYRIEDALIGETTITLITTSQISDYTVGYWICIMGLCTQDQGYPQNNHFFEYRQITAIDTMTGVITLDQGLQYNYYSHWPCYNNGPSSSGLVDEAGPATAYPMFDNDVSRSWPVFKQPWDQQLTVRNLSIDNPDSFTPSAANVRTVLWEDCDCPLTNPFPTITKSCIYRRCDFPGGANMEIDKLNEYCEFDTCTVHRILCQSSSTNQLVIRDCVLGDLTGTCKNTLIENTTVTNAFQYGPTGLGQCETLVIDGCTIPDGATPGRHILLSAATSISGGLITFTSANRFSTSANSNFVPGTPFWVESVSGQVLRVYNTTDITSGVSPADFIVHTDIPDPHTEIAAGSVFQPHPCPDITVTNSGGGPQMRSLSRAPANRPIFSYFHSGTWNGIDGDSIRLIGNIVSITVNVITAYTGVQSIALRPLGRASVYTGGILDTSFANSSYDPVIDITTTGTRVITPAGVTGTAGSDSGLSLGTNRWLTGTNPGVIGPALTTSFDNPADISGESSSVWPIVTVEIVTDQGI